MTRSVSRGQDRIFVHLPEDEHALLVQLPGLVADVAADPYDSVSKRMHPNAYPDATAEAREFSRMTHSDLDAARRRDIGVFCESLVSAATTGLTFSEAEAWVRLIGDVRLVLAARSGIGRDGELPDPSLAKPPLALVYYLGALQQEIVKVLTEVMESR